MFFFSSYYSSFLFFSNVLYNHLPFLYISYHLSTLSLNFYLSPNSPLLLQLIIYFPLTPQALIHLLPNPQPSIPPLTLASSYFFSTNPRLTFLTPPTSVTQESTGVHFAITDTVFKVGELKTLRRWLAACDWQISLEGLFVERGTDGGQSTAPVRTTCNWFGFHRNRDVR